MRSTLIIIGENIKENPQFIEYVIRKIKERVGSLDTIISLKNSDKDIFLTIEEEIKKSSNLIIVADSAFSLVSRILATISEDTLVMRDDLLTLSKALNFTKDSLFLEHDRCKIELLKVKEGREIPQIFTDVEEMRLVFFLFLDKKDLIDDRLNPLIKAYEADMVKSELIEGLFFITIEGFLYDQKAGLKRAIEEKFVGSVIFGDDLPKILCNRLINAGHTVTTMESCTGGLIASEITKNSGVSSIFAGGVISYSNEIKISLGVSRETIRMYGAVSLQTLYEMLDSSMRNMQSDISIAVSGIAGPGGGTKEKPVGLVYVGVKNSKGETIIEELHLKGDRIYIQKQSMLWAFKLLALSNKRLFFKKSENSLDN
jgi:nicotinamide-nucleotide amidase